MATVVQVWCALRAHDVPGGIAGIGGINPRGTRWSRTVDEAVADIESGRWSFSVYRGGRDIAVVVREIDGRKILLTEDDASAPGLLGMLPECPN